MQIVETMCDVCQKSDDVTHYALAAPDWYEIDLCAACYKLHVEPVAQVLKDHGRKTSHDQIDIPQDQPITRKEWTIRDPETCTICGFTARRHDLTAHALREHNAGLNVALGDPVRATCPECGFQLAASKGMATHRHHRHGVAFERGRNEKISAGPAS